MGQFAWVSRPGWQRGRDAPNAMKNPLQSKQMAPRRRGGWMAVDMSTAIVAFSIALPTVMLAGLFFTRGVAGTGELLGTGWEAFGDLGRTVLDTVTDRNAWMRAVHAVGVRSGGAQ